MQPSRLVSTTVCFLLPTMVLGCQPVARIIAEAVQETQEQSQPVPQAWSGRAQEDATMTNENLDAIIRELGAEVNGTPGYWEFIYRDVEMACISDTNYDRMRIIAPVIPRSEMTDEQLEKIIEANFHSALDARYAVNNGVLYSAFIHPLSPLTGHEFRSALEQVATLAQTFGTDYSSGQLTFGR